MSAAPSELSLIARFRRWMAVDRAAAAAQPLPPPWPPCRPGRTLLFIDFDGVLHRAESGTFEFLPNLVRILDARPEVDVVISSNWRINATREWLLDHFPSSCHDRIVGVTPVLRGRHQRQAECEAFAAAVGATRFLAVDDEHDLFHPACPWVVYTDRYEGLNADVEARVLRRLAILTGMSP